MKHWKGLLVALAAPLLLTGCLWGPGKFASDLTLKRDGSFVLNYRGEVVLQVPPFDASQFAPEAWDPKTMAHCHRSGNNSWLPSGTVETPREGDPERPCSAAELAQLKAQHKRDSSDNLKEKRKESDQMAQLFGLSGLDDEANRAFAAKLSKYAGWRSVTYRGHGVFDVDYHFEGRATQDFLFPVLPDNSVIVPFVALTRRADGSVLVKAPAFTGSEGSLSAAANGMGDIAKGQPASHAQGRFTVITDGEILTNNSEDGPAPDPTGRQLHWDVDPSSSKIPEALIRLQ